MYKKCHFQSDLLKAWACYPLIRNLYEEDQHMENKKMELIFILDRSGSMTGLESDTIGGYNAMLKKQQQEPGEALLTTVLFDDRIELLHDRENLHQINPITNKDYYVRGTTALLDAIGTTITRTSNEIRKEQAEDRQVMVVITTDGMENASKEYSYHKIRELITQQQEDYGWEFIFLGANIDAIQAASEIGISKDKAANYHADQLGTELQYEVINEAVTHVRTNKKLDKSWKERIDTDYKSR